eukprot:Gb_27768 [translate_table: standard]
MVGLQSAIREQRRDRKYIASDILEVEPNIAVYEVDQFTNKSACFSPSFEDSEDFDVINEWIREPDCWEMPNTETDQASKEDYCGGIHCNNNNRMEAIEAANGAETESRNIGGAQEMRQVWDEFGPTSLTIEASSTEVESVEAKFGEVCLDGHALGNNGEILSENPPTEQNVVFPLQTQFLTTSSNGVSEISIENVFSFVKPKEEYNEDTSSVQSKEDSKEAHKVNPCFCDGEKIKVPTSQEKSKVQKGEESEAESGEIVSEDDGNDCTNMVEPDSDYFSDSSSSSSSSEEEDEDVEEGEIKLGNAKRNLQTESLDDIGSSEDEGPKGPIQSKHELQVLPLVPPVNVVLEHHHQTQPVGVISSVLGASVVVEGIECHSALNEGTILWITEERLPLGVIDEVFGPVKNPYYVVRFNSAADIPDFVREGVNISYVSEFASYVLNDASLYKKGYDVSGDTDEEISEEVEFSDDEKEAEYKRTIAKAKRGTESRENIQKDYGKPGKKQEFVDKRKNKGRGGRSQHYVNNANGLKDGTQEMGFTSKQPFQNRSRGWSSSMTAKQSKNCTRPRGLTLPQMPPPFHSLGGHSTCGNSVLQQNLHYLCPTSGSLTQNVIRPAYSVASSQSMFAGASTSTGTKNSTPAQDAAGGLHLVQPPVVGGQSVCASMFNSNSQNFLHSMPLHDQAGGIHPGQSHSRPLHDPVGGISPGQPHSRPLHGPVGEIHPGQSHPMHSHEPMGGILPGQPHFRPSLEDPSRGIHPGQNPMFGGLVFNGNQINNNPLGLHQMQVHPAYLGSPAQSNGVHPGLSLTGGAWNARPTNHIAGGVQLSSSDPNQGVVNSLQYNQIQTCFGMPLSHHPQNFTSLYANMGMNTLCNTGSFPVQNILPYPMPWGPFAPAVQGNPNQPVLQGNQSQQFQNCVPLDSGSVPFSRPNNLISCDGTRPPLPPGPPPQVASRGHSQPN